MLMLIMPFLQAKVYTKLMYVSVCFFFFDSADFSILAPEQSLRHC